MRLIDADALKGDYVVTSTTTNSLCNLYVSMEQIAMAPTVKLASPWHRVENGLPKKAGEYIVAYHPCWWNDVKTSVTEIGIDTFRGKTSWAKRKFQRVTHWMEKPEPPQEENK